MVYMNMRSLDLRDVASVNLYGELCEQRISHVDTLQVLLELGWRTTVGDLLDRGRAHLAHCCRAGNVAALRLLESHFSGMCEQIANDAITDLIVSNSVDMLAYLMAKYPDLALGHESISVAVCHNRPEILKLILTSDMANAHFWYMRVDGMKSCIQNNGLEVIQLLLEYKMSFHYGDAIRDAVRYNRVEILKLLVNQATRGHEIALCHCAQTGNLELVKQTMLTFPDEVNIACVNSAFSSACSRGHLDIAQLLLSSIPQVTPSYRRNQALRSATGHNELKVVSWLLTLEDVDPLDGKKCALKIAMKRASADMYKLLLKHSSVWHYDLDFEAVNIDAYCLDQEARSKLDKIAQALQRYFGMQVTCSEMFSWMTNPTNSYLSLLQFIVIKSPDDIELLDRLDNSDGLEVEHAIESILYTGKVHHYSSTFTAYRALLLSIEHKISLDALVARLRVEGASEDGLYHAISLVGAYIH
ncbi:Hypothetical protein POVR2_LOCUS111 [uncultured virus]|nr:Hypothetical protein POVR2_LOCUS111 [uncultured virus]